MIRFQQQLLVLVWLGVSGCLIAYLDWGLPRAEWVEILQRYSVESTARMEQMLDRLSARNEEAWRATGAASVLGIKRTKVHQEQDAAFSDLDQFAVHRRYILASRGIDEYGMLATVARLGRNRTFDPRSYRYGGAHLYPVAACLGAAYFLKRIPSSIREVVVGGDSQGLRAMYLVVRGLSAVLFSLSIGALALWYWRRERSILLSVSVLVMVGLAPLSVAFAKSGKPLANGTSFAVLALLALMWDEGRRDRIGLILASCAAGLVIGTQLTTLPILAFPTAYVALLSSRDLRARALTWLQCVALPTGVAYLAFNPFVLSNPRGMAESVGLVADERSYGYGPRFSLSVVVDVGQTLIQGMGPALFLLFLVGLFIALVKGSQVERAAGVTALAGLFTSASYFGGAQRFSMYLLPVCACVAVAGLRELVSHPSSRHFHRAALGIAGLLLALNGVTATETLIRLSQEREGVLEEQVTAFLEKSELRGKLVASEKFFPAAQVPLPLYGVRWIRFDVRESWPEWMSPEYLVVRAPLDSYQWQRGPAYELAAALSIPRSALHRWLAYATSWSASTYIYRLRDGEAHRKTRVPTSAGSG